MVVFNSVQIEDRHANPTERWDEYVLELNSVRSVHGSDKVLSFLPEHDMIKHADPFSFRVQSLWRTPQSGVHAVLFPLPRMLGAHLTSDPHRVFIRHRIIHESRSWNK